jgi:membrane protease YdiL (CAAX protease family)
VTPESKTQSVESSGAQEMALTDRALAGWEIASVVFSIVIVEWMATNRPDYTRAIMAVPVAFAIIIIILSHNLRSESVRDLGFRFDNFLKALSLLVAPAIVAALLCLIIGKSLGTTINLLRWHSDRYLPLQFAVGFCWALAQQYALQGFINRRAMIVLGRGWRSVFLTAAIFSALHLPNIWLMVITLAGGLIWAAVYQRVPNLFALALTHAVMTWFIVSTLPATALHRLRVGLGYFF